ncbi:putative Rhamnogalacturonate lyase [Seiridium cardinale]|uniref:rhamnogalacturonan endolyase n=1 Tax=Seiridium cardinale TaxID=138064 RepID=A0ABR2XAU6_9PEZI
MRPSHLITSASIWPALVTSISVTEGDSTIVVAAEDDSDFTVTVDSSTGSITSILYGGTEYQNADSESSLASGLGSATVSYTATGDYVVVTVVADNDDFDLTHYYVFQDGVSAIALATDANSEPSVGELRYIFRLDNLPEAYKEGDVSDITDGEAIEASDVYLFYSSERFIDDDVYCAYAEDESVHACFLANVQSREKSSGGPFHRDINLNKVADYHSVTFYMNSGHVPTEAYRTGFFGPYIFSFSGSSIPSWDDFDFDFSSLDLDNYVGDDGRGFVAGTASGTSDDFDTVVHWYNDDYQSWVYASDGEFVSPALVAGTYTQVLYQQELVAATATVEVTAGATAAADITADSDIITGDRTTIFQVGDYDGQPTGFLNADLQLRMHPSDDRMASWEVTDFIVGTNTAADLPMALFKGVNDGIYVNFTLDSVPGSDVTARVATTLSFAGARPLVSLNDDAGDEPAAPTKIDSRGVTRGAYRGYGEVYTFTWSSDTLVEGDNWLQIDVISGSDGDDFLAPNVILDAIELYY